MSSLRCLIVDDERLARESLRRLLAELPAALTAGGLKPEALLPLEQTGTDLKVLILSDSGKNGAPVAVTLPAP